MASSLVVARLPASGRGLLLRCAPVASGHGNAGLGPVPEGSRLRRTASHAKPRTRSLAGPAGLALGLLTPFSWWGWAALPGLVLCLWGLLRRSYAVPSLAGALVCCLLGLQGCPFVPARGRGPDVVRRFYANAYLRHFGWPSVPSTARRIEYTYRVFGAWGDTKLYLRFDAPRGAIADFVSRARRRGRQGIRQEPLSGRPASSRAGPHEPTWWTAEEIAHGVRYPYCGVGDIAHMWVDTKAGTVFLFAMDDF